MIRKTPKWESDLWYSLSTGDGMHCPLYSNCRIREKGGWCLDDNKEQINWLLDTDSFNFSSFDFIESGACYGEFKMVEMLAQRYLKDGGVRCPPVPTEIISLADGQHPVEVRLVPLKACHGAVWHLQEEWVIQLNENDTPATRRFILFHEVFHILAHCRTIPVFRKKGTKEGSFNELLADYFAVCILMPREWVREKWAEVKDLDRMAEIFDVPKSAMCIRLKRLGLI